MRRSTSLIHLGAAMLVFLFTFAMGTLRGEERILFSAFVNGQPSTFCLDTGAETLALLTKGASRLGVAYTNPPAGEHARPGNVLFGVSEECEFVCGTSTNKIRFHVIDLPAVLHWEFDGVVGWPVLKDRILKIDALLGHVSDTYVPRDVGNWLLLPFSTNADALALELPRPKGKPVKMLLDTGDDGGVRLSAARWEEWKAAHPKSATTMQADYFPGAGLVVSEQGWAKELRLGPVPLTDVPVSLVSPAHTASGYEVSLGLAAMRRLEITTDGTRGVAYLKVRTSPSLPYQHNRLGAVFAPRDFKHDDLVAHVAAASPAVKAGLRNGDLLLKIDRLDVTKWQTDPTVLPLSRFWEQPAGTTMDLTVKRGEKTFTTTVTLKDILGP